MDGNSRFIYKWGEKRVQNKWKYYFIYGSLLKGGELTIILTFVNLIMKDFSLLKFILSLLISLIFGFFYGIWKWKYNEKKYQSNLKTVKK